jgi:hypothetical protein
MEPEILSVEDETEKHVVSTIGYIIIPFFLSFVIGGLLLSVSPDVAHVRVDNTLRRPTGDDCRSSRSPSTALGRRHSANA